ncbi:MAG: ATPase domain-containing protein [archaeon]|jgi:circadian clock protein KaiC
MQEDGVFIPSEKASSPGFSIKMDNLGSTQIKPEKDSLTGEKEDDYSVPEKEIVVERVNDGSDTSRVKTGIVGFDELIEGGFERESIVLTVGSSGTGKTILSMQFLYKGIVDYNEPGVFISFEEERDSLFKHSLQFGWDFENLEKNDKFRLLVFKPHQVPKILEEGGGQIRDALAEVGAKRVVIDSITAYGLLFRDEYKRREKILEFFNLLRRWGVTSMIVCEDSPKDVEEQEGSIGFISDAIVSLYYEHDKEKGIRIHSLEVLKMRGTKHTNKVCAMNFEKDGITVYPDVEVF